LRKKRYIFFKKIYLKAQKLKGGYDVDKITKSNINIRQSIH